MGNFKEREILIVYMDEANEINPSLLTFEVPILSLMPQTGHLIVLLQLLYTTIHTIYTVFKM